VRTRRKKRVMHEDKAKARDRARRKKGVFTHPGEDDEDYVPIKKKRRRNKRIIICDDEVRLVNTLELLSSEDVRRSTSRRCSHSAEPLNG